MCKDKCKKVTFVRPYSVKRVLNDSEQREKDLQDAIENIPRSFIGCRVVEPKLWEERYQ